ncbi:MAG TPA: PHP domain-containing protein [Chloroflexota bacterium]|nr:PHP domain-containing protein [Chloroflexota bacterium]
MTDSGVRGEQDPPRGPPPAPTAAGNGKADTGGRQIDWHNHSTWSDGGGTVAEIARRAAARGITLGLSDHGLRDNRRLRTPEQLAAYLNDLEPYDVMRGLEITVGDLEPGVSLDAFDYVIGSLHHVHLPQGMVSAVRYLNWRAGIYPSYDPSFPPAQLDRRIYFDAWLRDLEATCRRWPVTILGHFCLLPEHANARGTYILDEEPEPDATAAAWLDATIELCIRYDVAIELNSKSRVPSSDTVKRALRLGARFSLGSDSHDLRRVGDVSYGRELAHRLGIPPSRFIGASRARHPAPTK